MGAAEDENFFDVVDGEPFEGVVEHGGVDEGEEDFRMFSGDGTETLQCFCEEFGWCDD